MNQSTNTPGRSGYALGCGAMLLALCTPIVAIVLLFAGGDALVRFEAPGEVVFEAESAGSYSVYHEYQTTFDGRVYSAASGGLQGLALDVRSQDSGEAVEVSAPAGTATYSFNGRSGVLVASFDAPASGTYVVSATARDGAHEPAVLAVGRGVASRIVGGLLGSMAFAGVLGVIGMIVFGRTYFRRRQAQAAGTAGTHRT